MVLFTAVVYGTFVVAAAARGTGTLAIAGVFAVLMLYTLILPALTLSRWFALAPSPSFPFRSTPLRFVIVLFATLAIDVGIVWLTGRMSGGVEGRTITAAVLERRDTRTDERHELALDLVVHNYDDRPCLPPEDAVAPTSHEFAAVVVTVTPFVPAAAKRVAPVAPTPVLWSTPV